MPLMVSDPILCEIGRIAVYQTHIEGQMALFVPELLGIEEGAGNLITSKLSRRKLTDLLGSLLRNKFGEQNNHLKRFESFRKDTEKTALERNRSIHSMWSFGSTLKSTQRLESG